MSFGDFIQTCEMPLRPGYFNSFVLRLVLPAAAVGMAVFAAEHGWELFNYIGVPFWLAVAVVMLDSFIWLQHVRVHAVPLLWRLHRVHALRFAGAALAMRVKDSNQVLAFQTGQ